MSEKEYEEKDIDNNIEENDVVDGKDKKEKKLKPKEQIEKLSIENYSLREKYLSAEAELENYKKRMNKERIEDRKYAAMDLINDLLIPLGQLKKVVEMETDDNKLKNFLIGFKMINDQIYQTFEQQGLKEIKALGEVFDPNYHYAVEKENDKSKANGIITEVIQIGYMYKERILRPSMVKVNEWSEENGENNK